MDDTREKQRAYEEAKRKELAQAKSADDLRKIEQRLRGQPSLQQLQAINDQAEREALRLMRWQTMQPLKSWAYGYGNVWPEEIPVRQPPPLPEEHIVAALTGYRAWNVPLFVDELRSVAKPAKWKPYQRFEAVCESAQCNGVSCSCGIYAFNKMDLVQAEYKQADRSKRYVYGECWLWGRILECKMGYRAQFAYPKAFVNNGAIAKRMSEVFGVALLKP